jgi:hypothetical protein
MKRLVLAACVAAAFAPTTFASSHREAPSITVYPKVDATDFYMFRSYETGRAAFTTVMANYYPLQDPFGGPNYFKLDPNALYEIHIDNNGDAKEDLTFQFRFQNNFKATSLNVGGKTVAIPLTQSGTVSAPNAAALNVNEKFTLTVVRGDRRTGTASAVTNATTGATTFDKPSDNIGTKTIPDYPGYAAQHIYPITIPGCSTPGKVFVGQRKDPFRIKVGVIFDLVNAPLGVISNPANNNALTDDLIDKNTTTLALELPTACLTAGSDPVIGGWTTASLRQGRLLSSAPKTGYQTAVLSGGAWTQVSRLGNPLINEVIIGLPDKDKFNGSKPQNDTQFIDYVTNPTLPELLEVAFANTNLAPTNFPRNDLVQTFLQGIAGVNRPANVTASEMLRLNTSIAAQPFASQNRLGIVGAILAGEADRAGFPNGRRPKDDVVDIALIAAMGGLCVANGNTNALGFGTACNPSVVPLGRPRSGFMTASTRRHSRPARCCSRRSRTWRRRCLARRADREEDRHEQASSRSSRGRRRARPGRVRW